MTETYLVEIDSDLVDAADVEDVLARGGIKREAVDVSADGPSRWSNPLSEPNALVGPGAVLYDAREPERRPCCSKGGRCLAHVVGVYEDTATDEVYYRVMDGTHTTEHWVHQGDLLALYEPAGWSFPTGVKPTYVLTRRHGVDDHHDRMTETLAGPEENER